MLLYVKGASRVLIQDMCALCTIAVVWRVVCLDLAVRHHHEISPIPVASAQQQSVYHTSITGCDSDIGSRTLQAAGGRHMAANKQRY